MTKYTAESLAEKWFKIGRIRNKFEFQKDLELLIKEAVEEALSTVSGDPLGDPANYRLAIREPDEKQFVIYKELLHKTPPNWSVVIPGKGLLSKKYYSPEGVLAQEFFKKCKVIKTEAELKLNS